jgi:AcrR family transcriptional regulator
MTMPHAKDETRDRRRGEILDAAFELLAERGYAGATMLAIAGRAGASKETLYAWFGDKRGLFEALVLRQADAMNRALGEALQASSRAHPATVLRRFGEDLLTLLLGPRAVAINRAAIAEAARDAELGRLLSARGRETTGPLVVHYLEAQRAAGRLDFPDAGAAFDVLLGLLLRDWQIRVLLGAIESPPAEALHARAAEAVNLFLALYGPRTAEPR